MSIWSLTGISLYTLVWMIGDWRALRLRTSTVTPDSIQLRLGTRWEVEIPLVDDPEGFMRAVREAGPAT